MLDFETTQQYRSVGIFPLDISYGSEIQLASIKFYHKHLVSTTVIMAIGEVQIVWLKLAGVGISNY